MSDARRLTRYWVPQVYCNKEDGWPESPLQGGGYDIYKADEVQVVLKEIEAELAKLGEPVCGYKTAHGEYPRSAIQMLLARVQEISHE